MDDFAKKAFAQAQEESDHDEFKAYMEGVVADFGSIFTAAAIQIGLSKMESLSKAIVTNGLEGVFSEYTRALCILCFSIGYEKGRLSQ